MIQGFPLKRPFIKMENVIDLLIDKEGKIKDNFD